MKSKRTDIYVYADWIGLGAPQLMGMLSAQQAKGRKAFSFLYEKRWIQSDAQRLLDPDIQWYTGPQHPMGKENFGMFMDSMPDTWGRKLMQRKAAQVAEEKGSRPVALHDIDYLLGVFDETRMGALRFKLDPEGPFLDNDPLYPTPPWSTVGELQQAAGMIESDKESRLLKKYISVLIAPGSSLGGARPKANILDQQSHFWIAKFPAKSDLVDKAAWEYLAYRLALKAGLTMAESKLESIRGGHRTFFTKRFDRVGKQRIHFASAMTMTAQTEDSTKVNFPSYLDIALFIQTQGCHIREDLHQLWRRIIFNIAISNTDDHLRNHGFLLTEEGWRLSPAFDLNPSIDKGGLQLNIDNLNNELSFQLAKSVGPYFQLNDIEMKQIIQEVLDAVAGWRGLATEIGIKRNEIEQLAAAFHLDDHD